MNPFRSLLAAVLVATIAGDGFQPARLKSAVMPTPLLSAVSGGEVFLEIEIDATGHVSRVDRLRVTPPFTDSVEEAVRNWRFDAAAEERRPAVSRVLVAALFRPPTLYDGQTLGSPPRDVALPSDAIPFPIANEPPHYPPRGIGNGGALVEIRVARDGSVEAAKIVDATPGFEQSALQAAQHWRFRPARRKGAPVAAVAYVWFGFRAPIVGRP